MAVISLYDYTTNMVKPWADAGFVCYCVDIQHPKGETVEGNIIKVGANVLDWLPPRGNIDFFAAFPPCTHTAVSGARWFKDKGLGALIEALTLFDCAVKLAEWSNAPYMIENPVGTVSTYYRKPDHIFQPWEYGDLWYKKTCLWTGNNFIMPDPIHQAEPEGVTDKLHMLPPSKNRANLRSETPINFAQAVFRSNYDQNP